MPEDRSRPDPAYYEEYDSDQSAVKPGTRVQARSDANSVRPSRPPQRPRDAASDSGYSSHVSATAVKSVSTSSQQTIKAVPIISQPPPPSASARSKPVIHRSESQRNSQRTVSRSASVSSKPRTTQCADPTCRDPTCGSQRNTETRYTLPREERPQQASRQQQQPQRTQGHSSQDQTTPYYYQAPAYQYAQPPPAQHVTIPNARAEQRPRTASSSRARPVSWAGANYALAPGGTYGSTPPQGGYPSGVYGMPPSPSSRQQGFATYPYAYPPAGGSSHMGSTPPMTTSGMYMPPSPATAMPPQIEYASQSHHRAPSYSTRQPTVPFPSLDTTNVPGPQPPTAGTQTVSARRTSQLMPGSFPGEAAVSDSGSSTGSSSDYSSDSEYSDRERHDRFHHHYERERRESDKRRRHREDRRLMPPPPARRPSLRSAHTTPNVSGRPSREPLRRNPRSDTDLDYPYASDHMDSDRTTRPVVDRRLTHTTSHSSQSSRRPSVSTASSSDRTKATTVSGSSGSGRYIVEDASGRRRVYPSLEQAELMARRLSLQQRTDDAEAYQTHMRGGKSPELTAENIKRSQQSKPSSSRVSGSSRKSGGSSRMSKSDSGFQIKAGDTVLHVTGDATVEMRQTEDGEQRLIIGSGSGRESRYFGGSSKSSSSRMGRSRNGSIMGRRRDTIHEEDGYEPGY